MKKMLIIAVVGCFAFGLTSCKKTHTCTCTETATGTKTTYTIGKSSKKDAETACKVFVSSTETCSIN